MHEAVDNGHNFIVPRLCVAPQNAESSVSARVFDFGGKKPAQLPCAGSAVHSGLLRLTLCGLRFALYALRFALR